MAYEIPINAIKKEIERLNKKRILIHSNINASSDFLNLRNKRLELATTQGRLQCAIELSSAGLKKLTKNQLADTQAELARVNKEIARLERLRKLDVKKEIEKEVQIENDIFDLAQELCNIERMANRW
ncbi:hypothetical protein [Zooshikella sp. RANM57]|uniref:hypothetical protein n=1 Tax=Zooshikella sp. RANM57 TaxID=3425863 RepID=UPI003D6DF461